MAPSTTHSSSFPSLPSAFTPLTPASTSSLSSSSSAVSRQSSIRSTASVVAVPMRKPVRGSATLQRGNSGGVGRGFDSSSVTSNGVGSLTGSYFVAAPNGGVSGAPMMRRGSSGEGGGSTLAAPPTNGLQVPELGVPLEASLTTWSAVGAAVNEIRTSNGQEEKRPEMMRADASTLSEQPPTRPANSREGSAGSVVVIRKTVGDFTFGEVLGEGSYSTVSLVTDKHPPHRSYALKVLDKDHIKREKKTKYVLIERDTLKTLDGHPGIVRLYWTFQDQRSLYYVLELAKNGELLKWIKKFGSFSLPSARFYAAQILSAVEHMHSKGVIHRDLKPENILLDDEMRIKVTDFGTAKLLGDKVEAVNGEELEKPRSRSFVGTPEYVSPEILSEGKESSPSSDYWGFGCILYQILAGRPPFHARTEYLMFQKIVKLEYEFPLGFPPDAKDLVQKLLVVDPGERLGGNAEGISAIKSHPFFTADPTIDFSTIWTIDPPPIETGLVEPKKEQRGEFVLLDTFGQDDSEREMDSGDDDSGTRRSEEGEEEEGDKVVDGSEHAKPVEPATKWTGVLLPSETILFASPVLVKRGFLTKKRNLILTDYPRLICIKETPLKVTLKSEVFVGAALRGGVTKPGAMAFVRAETDGDKSFMIKTSQRTFKYEEPSGGAGRWVSELRDAHSKGLLGEGGAVPVGR